MKHLCTGGRQVYKVQDVEAENWGSQPESCVFWCFWLRLVKERKMLSEFQVPADFLHNKPRPQSSPNFTQELGNKKMRCHLTLCYRFARLW